MIFMDWLIICMFIVSGLIMLTKSTLITLLVLIFTGVVKANLHFIRMVVMAAAGLAGMYLIHLLAQDYNKITNRPAATAAKALVAAGKALGIFKRSVPNVSSEVNVVSQIVIFFSFKIWR